MLDMPDADGVVACGAGDAGAVGVPCDGAHDAAVIWHVCALLHGARVHECDFAFVEDGANGERRSIGRERGDIGILGLEQEVFARARREVDETRGSALTCRNVEHAFALRVAGDAAIRRSISHHEFLRAARCVEKHFVSVITCDGSERTAIDETDVMRAGRGRCASQHGAIGREPQHAAVVCNRQRSIRRNSNSVRVYFNRKAL